MTASQETVTGLRPAGSEPVRTPEQSRISKELKQLRDRVTLITPGIKEGELNFDALPQTTQELLLATMRHLAYDRKFAGKWGRLAQKYAGRWRGTWFGWEKFRWAGYDKEHKSVVLEPVIIEGSADVVPAVRVVVGAKLDQNGNIDPEPTDSKKKVSNRRHSFVSVISLNPNGDPRRQSEAKLIATNPAGTDQSTTADSRDRITGFINSIVQQTLADRMIPISYKKQKHKLPVNSDWASRARARRDVIVITVGAGKDKRGRAQDTAIRNKASSLAPGTTGPIIIVVGDRADLIRGTIHNNATPSRDTAVIAIKGVTDKQIIDPLGRSQESIPVRQFPILIRVPDPAGIRSLRDATNIQVAKLLELNVGEVLNRGIAYVDQSDLLSSHLEVDKQVDRVNIATASLATDTNTYLDLLQAVIMEGLGIKEDDVKNLINTKDPILLLAAFRAEILRITNAKRDRSVTGLAAELIESADNNIPDLMARANLKLSKQHIEAPSTKFDFHDALSLVITEELREAGILPGQMPFIDELQRALVDLVIQYGAGEKRGITDATVTGINYNRIRHIISEFKGDLGYSGKPPADDMLRSIVDTLANIDHADIKVITDRERLIARVFAVNALSDELQEQEIKLRNARIRADLVRDLIELGLEQSQAMALVPDYRSPSAPREGRVVARGGGRRRPPGGPRSSGGTRPGGSRYR